MTMPITTSQVGNLALEDLIRKNTTTTFRRTQYQAIRGLFDQDIIKRSCQNSNKPIELLIMVYETFRKTPSALLKELEPAEELKPAIES